MWRVTNKLRIISQAVFSEQEIPVPNIIFMPIDV